MPELAKILGPEKALIFRIVHWGNVRWILKNGLHSRNSGVIDPDFKSIGNRELIERRRTREVPIEPYGSLGDYVSFYFTPYSPMLYNIRTGYGGISKHSNDEIVILVSSLARLRDTGTTYVFTDRHAYLALANYFSDEADLDRIDWEALRSRNFRRDVEDPERIERYQAEALAHRRVPVEALIGVACHSRAVKTELQQLAGPNHPLRIEVRSDWYFR